MEIRCVKGMCGLKVAGREENLGFKGLICHCTKQDLSHKYRCAC